MSSISFVITYEKKRNLNGFSGYEILGEATYRKKPVNFVVLGFIDPETSVNFAAYIIYWKGAKKDEKKNIDIERKIIESIEPIK